MNFKVALLAVIFAIFSPAAHAELVVRDSSISETEFRAQALATGRTPASDWLAGENQSHLSPETSETFRLRLVEAQKEWIERTPSTTITPSIDRLLTLATEADWSESDRDAFITFFIRKFELSPGEETRRKLRGYSMGRPLDLNKLSPSRKTEWLQNEKNDLAEWTSSTPLINALPIDVVAVLINGQKFDRDTLPMLNFPAQAFRLTLISNLYQPVSLRVESGNRIPSLPTRFTWLDENCLVRPSLSILQEDLELQPIVKRTCLAIAEESRKSETESGFIKKFGIQNESSDLKPPTFPSQQTSIVNRPWFWGAASVLVIGAVIASVHAIERNQNQTVTPVHREGW